MSKRPTIPPPSPARLRSALEDGMAQVVDAGVEVPPGSVEGLARYLDLLVDWSSRVNLVSRRELPALVEKHLLPSCPIGFEIARMTRCGCSTSDRVGGFRGW